MLYQIKARLNSFDRKLDLVHHKSARTSFFTSMRVNLNQNHKEKLVKFQFESFQECLKKMNPENQLDFKQSPNKNQVRFFFNVVFPFLFFTFENEGF
jgi:hypothetical protein